MVAKRIISCLISIVLLFSLTISCYAAVDGTRLVTLSGITDSTDETALGKLFSSDYSGPDSGYRTYFCYTGGTVYVHEDFDYLNYEKQTKVITDLISSLQESENLSGLCKQAIYNSLSDYLGDSFMSHIPEVVDATTADVLGGLSFMAPFQGTFGLILGFAVIFIALFLVVSTVLDIAYLISPNIMNWFLDETGEKPKKRRLLISREAKYCAEASIQGTLKSNIYITYLGKRWVTYVILSVCILYLLSGEIAKLIGGILDIAQGII